MAGLRGELLQLVAWRRVVVIDAATGSGKSTLVPLCLAGQCVEAGRSCRVAVTQPRRIAAKGLARRVAEQCGTAVGDIAGYRMGHDRQDNGALIVYVTAGHLLEALVHNPRHLHSFSHIVLDEVHERFVEADFLMSLLRLLLSRPETQAVRIVVMSATLQQALGSFFRPLLLPAPAGASPGKLSLPGMTPFEVRDFLWEDIRGEWPDAFAISGKEPGFQEAKPAKLRLLPTRRRSDQLTKLCRELAPLCARLLCELQERGMTIALVFLPGLDQMREVEESLSSEVHHQGSYKQPKVFLMHSALDEDTYRGALDPAEPGEWRVVLATNIAESSLTVPGVSAVIDFGLHRVNIYDDETRMSMLATAWCSKASMKQRRGRTGRTNAGVYVQLLPRLILDDLPDFDDSGVERSPLLRIALEAAHLTQLLAEPAIVRAGLPVGIPGIGTGTVSFWDGPRRGWRVAEVDESGSHGEENTHPEKDLKLLRLDAKHMLGLLPTPPREDRVRAALMELHELGALADGDTPSILGTACLKLPVDVPLGRLVVLGWALGCPGDAAMMAAALSLAPSCDVLRTPFNTKSELDHSDMRLLRQVTDLRRKADRGSLSEPLTVRALCLEWLQSGGGSLGRQPRGVSWRSLVHVRLWTQFTEKFIELLQALLRLLPSTAVEARELQGLLQTARGGRMGAKLPEESPVRLAALTTWALAPLGFVAVGQAPALFGGGTVDVFTKVLKENRGMAASSLWWPRVTKVQEAGAREVAMASGCRVQWTATHDGDVFLGAEAGACQDSSGMPEGLEFLCRICGPFNGKETFVCTQGTRRIAVRPPRHPCSLNWYMPRRDGHGLLEVRVSWKSQAETLVHVPRPCDRGVACRPKRFLVASGGEYHNTGGRRSVVLRGATLLPSGDGGRSALLWLLAAGMPREAKFVALAAPCRSLARGDFEVRAVRFWQRTICLSEGEPLTGADLQTVNLFRSSLLELQRRRPHRLAGTWRVTGSGELRHIECLDAAQLALVVSGGLQRLMLRSEGGPCWQAEVAESSDGAEHPWVAVGSAEEERAGVLSWSDGSRWEQLGANSDWRAPALDGLAPQTVLGFRRAAELVLGATEVDGAPPCGDCASPRWPARLVPVRTLAFEPAAEGFPAAGSALAPLDLASVEARLAAFAARLSSDDLVAGGQEVSNLDCVDDSDDDDDTAVDVSQEAVNEEYMWRLAEQEDFSPGDSRQLCFVESALALPPTAICVECEQEGKPFSKTQLGRHPDERRCQDCVNKSIAAVYRPVNAPGGPAGPRPGAGAPPPAPKCSACGTQLSRENCSASQRQKPPAKRRCNGCVGTPAQPQPEP